MISGLRVFTLLCLCAARVAFAAPELRFVDECTRGGEWVTSSFGPESTVEIEFEGLDPQLPVWVELRAEIAEPPTGQLHATPQSFHSESFEIRPDSSGRIQTRRDLRLREDRLPAWITAQLFYTQGPRGKSGSSRAQVYLTGPKPDGMFVLNSPVQCTWESPVSIVSEYLENLEASRFMSIRREFAFRDLESVTLKTGIGFGVTEPVVPPLLPIQVYFDVSSSEGHGTERSSRIEKSFEVQPREGGFWGQRMSFNRVSVQELLPVRERDSCLRWRVGRRGLLDIGRPVEDFYTVPKDLSRDPLRSVQFMDGMRPALRTCAEVPTGPVDRFRVGHARGLAASDSFLLFFPNAQIPSGGIQ